uniref:Uncharacterized protein n=1 Tax=Oryza brachyantha TaxID=4533 RepID=J3M093_ORYBR
MKTTAAVSQQQHLLDELAAAAKAAEVGNSIGEREILARLNQQLPPIGKPFLHSASYLKDALLLALADGHHATTRLTSLLDVALKLAAYKSFSDLSPVLYIIDFDLGVGGQWASFLQELAHRCDTGLTTFVSATSHYPLELRLTRDNLSQFAADLGIPFEFNAINLDAFDPVELIAPIADEPYSHDLKHVTHGSNSHPPGGFVNFLSNGNSSQPINLGDDTSDGDYTRGQKRRILDWSVLGYIIQMIQSKQTTRRTINTGKMLPLSSIGPPLKTVQDKSSKSKITLRELKRGLHGFVDAYLERLEQLEPENRKFCESDVGQHFSLDEARDERPIGGKQAKEKQKRKRKDEACIIDLEDELHKFVEAQNTANEGRKEMLETQRRVSSEKLEARKLAYLATKEQKESAMLETYRSLMMQDTTVMSEDVRSEHVLALSHPTMSDLAFSSDDSDELDPSKVIEECVAEQSVLDSFASSFAVKINAALSIGVSQRQYAARKSIRRDHVGAHQRLMEDYFAEEPLYPESMFRTRFRMNKHLFLRIVNALGQWSPYFTYRADCASRIGLSPLQKCTAAMRMLAYGTPVDALDEYFKIGKCTALECLDKFAQGVIEVFGGKYLRRPTRDDVERILQVNESRGFPGMLGSIDCMHWRWEKCPLAWRGQFTRGDYVVPTMVLEAVASQDLHIWHDFFGIAGSNNDLNVLNNSPLFFDVLKGEAPQVQFSVNGNEYSTGYYLADGIYPE